MNAEVPALGQSVFAPAVRVINNLEQRIVAADEDADAQLWEQARLVVGQLDAGLSQRALAKQWINARTGEPYDERHVRFVRQVFEQRAELTPRPKFRGAYNDIANTGGPANRLVFNSGDHEWYTPAPYVDAARDVLGDIDLDPASCPAANEVVKAATFYTITDNGLAQPWSGRVFLNPPYAQPLIQQFVEKLATSVTAGTVTAAIVLVNNGTETEWFTRLAAVADVVCLPKGRVHFWNPAKDPATPLQGQAVLYLGPDADRFCDRFAAFGLVARIVRRAADDEGRA